MAIMRPIFFILVLAVVSLPLPAKALNISVPPGYTVTYSPGVNGTPADPNAPKAPAPSAPSFNQSLLNQGLCPAQTVQLCGQHVDVPILGVGQTYTVTPITPYKHIPTRVICALGVASDQFIDNTDQLCQLQTCTPGTAKICGRAVPVLMSTTAGQTITIAPAGVFAANAISHSIDVQCTGTDNDQPFYQLAPGYDLACASFACTDTTVRLCNADIPVAGGAALGEVQHPTMPKPFVPDFFTVQCVGSNGDAPNYQLTDYSGVTCQQAQ